MFSLDRSYMSHIRVSYGVLDLLRDVGGVATILWVITSILLDHHSKFNFILTAMKWLYLANTSNEHFFKKSEKEIQDKRI
jgi:hypothetical protein